MAVDGRLQLQRQPAAAVDAAPCGRGRSGRAAGYWAEGAASPPKASSSSQASAKRSYIRLRIIKFTLIVFMSSGWDNRTPSTNGKRVFRE